MLKFFFALILLLSFLNVKAQYFEEKSIEAGLNYHYPGNDYQEVGAGVTILDVNNDGWDDVFQSGGIFPSKLWINDKGKFIDGTKMYDLDQYANYFIQGVVAGDYNNDGFEDLFICNMGNAMNMGDALPPLLLKNINGKKFEAVMQNKFNQVGSYPGAAWGDFNKDGFIDLYVLNYINVMTIKYDSVNQQQAYQPDCNNNLFYYNNGGIDLEEIGHTYGIDDSGCGLAVSFSDFDNDNDVDLLILNDFGSWNKKGNKLYRNNYPEESFTDISEQSGFYSEFYGMGIGAGDYNNDGLMDYYMTNIGRNFFFTNESGSFTDKGKELKIDISFEKDSTKGTSWTGIFFDADNDGDLDLYVSKGYLNTLENVVVKDENKFFVNNGNLQFEDKSSSSGINDSLSHRGAATFDYDHDGDLDIISNVIKMQQGALGGLDQHMKLYENKTKGNHWIGIKLVGTDRVNSSCLGCSISFNIGDKKHIREVDGGSGHSSQSTRNLYFGLGDEKYVHNLEIEWLGGEKMDIKKLKANQAYTITQDGTISKLY